MSSNEFLELFKNQFDDLENPDEIQLSTAYKDLDDWSSLVAFSIISEVKSKLGKSLSGAEIRQCQTVEDLYNLVSSK